MDTCRVCLAEAEPGEPLITPCTCKGTMAFVHLACLAACYRQTKTQPIFCQTCRAPLRINRLQLQTEVNWWNYVVFAGWLLLNGVGVVVLGAVIALIGAVVASVAVGYIFLVGVAVNAVKALLGATYIPQLVTEAHACPRNAVMATFIAAFGPGTFFLVVLFFWLAGREAYNQMVLESNTFAFEDARAATEAQRFADVPLAALASRDFVPAAVANLARGRWPKLKLKSLAGYECALVPFACLVAAAVAISVLYAVHYLWWGPTQLLLWCTGCRLELSMVPGFGVDLLLCRALYIWCKSKVEWPTLRLEVGGEFAWVFAQTLVLPYLGGLIVYYAVFSEFPQPSLFPTFLLWLAGFLSWWDRRLASPRLLAMRRRFEPVVASPRGTARQWLENAVETGVAAWLLRRVLSDAKCRPLALSAWQGNWQGNFAWLAVIGVLTATPIAFNQPPCALAAFLWLKDAVWLRYATCYGILHLRTFVLALALFFVPLLVGRTLHFFFPLSENDFVLWLAGLGVELTLVGLRLAAKPPLELRHNRRFRKWHDARENESKRWRSLLISVVFCAHFGPEWHLVVGFYVASFGWPQQSYTWLMLAFLGSLGNYEFKMRIAAMLLMSGEWYLPVEAFRRWMVRDYPRVDFSLDMQELRQQQQTEVV